MSMSSLGAKAEPVTPRPVIGLVAAFCSAVEHETAAMRRTDKTHNKILLGS